MGRVDFALALGGSAKTSPASNQTLLWMRILPRKPTRRLSDVCLTPPYTDDSCGAGRFRVSAWWVGETSPASNQTLLSVGILPRKPTRRLSDVCLTPPYTDDSRGAGRFRVSAWWVGANIPCVKSDSAMDENPSAKADPPIERCLLDTTLHG